MPKMKTHKGLAKRVRVSANKKIKYKKHSAGHLMSGKPGKRKRRLRRKGIVETVLQKKLLVALGAA